MRITSKPKRALFNQSTVDNDESMSLNITQSARKTTKKNKNDDRSFEMSDSERVFLDKS